MFGIPGHAETRLHWNNPQVEASMLTSDASGTDVTTRLAEACQTPGKTASNKCMEVGHQYPKVVRESEDRICGQVTQKANSR